MGPYKDKPCYLCEDRTENGLCHSDCGDYLRTKKLNEKARMERYNNNLNVIQTKKIKLNPLKRSIYKDI